MDYSCIYFCAAVLAEELPAACVGVHTARMTVTTSDLAWIALLLSAHRRFTDEIHISVCSTKSLREHLCTSTRVVLTHCCVLVAEGASSSSCYEHDSKRRPDQFDKG